MTTLVALISGDFIVLGTDSLGTYSKSVIETGVLLETLDSNGRIRYPRDPLSDLIFRSEAVRIRRHIGVLSSEQPYSHITQTDKLHHINANGRDFGVMTGGRSSLGDRSIDSLIKDFENNHLSKMDLGSVSLDEIGEQMYTFMREQYEEAGETDLSELLLCGFDSANDLHPNSGTSWPKVVRIDVHNKPLTPESDRLDRLLKKPLEAYIEPDVVTGRVTKEITRLVQGIETSVASTLADYYEDSLEELEEEVNAFVEEIRWPRTRRTFRSDLFDDDPYVTFREEIDDQKSSLPIDYAGMNVQNSIDFVDFLINVQIKADEFSTRAPNVGGDVQIALIERGGFTWISKATTEWTHDGHSIKRPDRN